MNRKRALPRWQELTVVAQDPTIRPGGHILTTRVRIPAETISKGPWGHRAQVVDYDTSTDTLYAPCKYDTGPNELAEETFGHLGVDRILSSPQFHAQNAFALVMQTLARFEFALGRRLSWGFSGHQIKVVPHAFAEANAFYSRDEEALLFGYFQGRDRQPILSCLSHDVVVHETTHALLDGLRRRYIQPSSPDQAAFHEGFSDVVALLSVFAIPEVVGVLLGLEWSKSERGPKGDRVEEKHTTPSALRRSALLCMAEEMGQELSDARGQPLRRSLDIPRSPDYYWKNPEFSEPHRRGEILVAAVLNAFVNVWSDRLKEVRRDNTRSLDRRRVADEGSLVAERLLTAAIRAIDYCPPVHMKFGDFLSALLTGDCEMRPDDSLYHMRDALRRGFREYGIRPASTASGPEPGIWAPLSKECRGTSFDSSRCHFESLRRDSDEVFRFVWENRQPLQLLDGVFTRVESVRPCTRIGEDGFTLHETVAEYVQVLLLRAGDLPRLTGMKRPAAMSPDTLVKLHGGGVLVFDEFGQAKLHVHNRLGNWKRQQSRIERMADSGYYEKGAELHSSFAHIHRLRAINAATYPEESWL